MNNNKIYSYLIILTILFSISSVSALNFPNWVKSITGNVATEEYIACTDYTYSDWSSCADGRQTRTVISRGPEGCNSGDVYAIAGQPCNDQICMSEGEGIPVIPNAPKCCSGLTLINPKEENTVGSSGICTSKCGNGVCDSSESNYNCAVDCNQDELSCVNEGESIPVIPNAPKCCSGLTLINPREGAVLGSSGICTSKCGNGFCDSSESNYNCAVDCSEKITPIDDTISEKVKCVFVNSTQEQECYSADVEIGCKGQDTCINEDVKGINGQKLTWKSSCGGYAYTTIDGEDKYAVFYCSKQEIFESNSFEGASWSCHGSAKNGEKQSTGASGSCKSSEEWQQYAQEACSGSCSTETGKCGFNSFSVGAQCGKTIIVNPATDSKKPIDVTEKKKEGTTITCNGCLKEDKCYPLGYRKDSQFCSDNNEFIAQLDADFKCDNNFECGSNVCVSGNCVSPGLIESILNWFKKLFGNG